MRSRQRNKVFWLSTTVGLIWCSCASAQSTTSALVTDQGASTSSATLSEVVVTAEKRSQRILEVAAPVAAISGAELLRLHSLDILDLSAQTAGLNVTSDRVGDTHLAIRGISTSSTSASPTVATYIDDSPFGLTTGFANAGLLVPDLDPAELDQVEILKGPQGTLYGASALGGLVKYVTTPPSLTRYSARVEIDGTSVSHGGDGYGARGSINAPIIADVLGVTVNAYTREDPGYIDDPALGLKNLNSDRVEGGRIALLWKPAPHLDVKLSALLQDVKSNGTNDEDVDGATLQPSTGGLTQTRSAREPLKVRDRLYNATIDYDLGWASLMSASTYTELSESRIYDFTTSYGPLLTGALGIPDVGVGFSVPVQQEKISQEIRLTSAPSTFIDWMGGFFYTHEQSSHQESFNPFDTITGEALPLPSLLYANLESSYVEFAGYADAVLHLTSKIDIQGGVRYSANSQQYTQPTSGLLVGGASTLVTSSSDNTATFLVSPKYKFDQNNMVYARIASGYQPGGPNPLSAAEIAAGVPKSFAPDTLTNYEVGYKASLLDRTLTVDLSAYYIDWKKIQITSTYEGFGFEGNAASARSDGFETTVTYTPIAGLNFSFNGAYTDAKLTADAPGIGAVSGEELPNVPKWAATLNADYNFTLMEGYAAFAGGSVRYVGDRASGFVSGAPSNFIRPTLPSYTTLDLRAGVQHQTWALELYVKNVSDSRGLIDVNSLAFNAYSNPFTASVIQPRSIGFSISNKF